ncbi:hypothetical protein O181_026114 [Austropuccinia psidii MF-1]|uniref:Uncharacterized protein n=1 Tax=Austropuccinia psidii MF-1 TaxID=1389203 RepID=A0A9Q3H1B4_9BASI|nr:hypothetical protein [Austropuccinia psidii MF-1]
MPVYDQQQKPERPCDPRLQAPSEGVFFSPILACNRPTAVRPAPSYYVNTQRISLCDEVLIAENVLHFLPGCLLPFLETRLRLGKAYRKSNGCRCVGRFAMIWRTTLSVNAMTSSR